MKAPVSAEQKEYILRCLRQATVYQIGLWDTATEIAEILDRELGDVLEAIMHLGIAADTGMDLDAEDLEDFLNPRSLRSKILKPLPERFIQ